MKRKALMLSAALLMAGCSQPTYTTYSNMSLDSGFDTYFSLQAATLKKEDFDELFTSSVNSFSHYNQLFDIYHNYDGVINLKTINDNAGVTPISVDDDMMEMLVMAREMYELSDGEFDITLGAVLKIWHEYREDGLAQLENGQLGKVPDEEELKQAKGCTGWQYVELDEENNTVYINNPCVSLDVGGIAKGYTVEKISQQLQESQVKMAIIDAGGNSKTINGKDDGSEWRIGIQNPDGSGSSLFVLTHNGTGSYVTSGDYQRYYVADDGNIYHHIIDPATLFPATYYHSVTILCESSAYADGLSTTLFTLPMDKGQEVIEQFNKAHPDFPASAIWVTDEPTDGEHSGYAEPYYVTYTADLEGKVVFK